MKIKLTVEVANDNGGQVDQKDLDRVVVAALGGVMKKFEGRVMNITDNTYEIIHGMIKGKMVFILDEEKKVEG